MTNRTYRVATFVVDGRVHCYTRWYNPQWNGCVEYDVEAVSGYEAKKMARDMRKRLIAVSKAPPPEGGKSE